MASKDSLQSCDEVICVSQGEAERRKEPQHIRTGTACKAMLFLDKAGAGLFVWNIQFYANHQSLSTDINNMRKVSCLHLGSQRLDDVRTYLACILHKVLVLHNIEYGESSCTSEVVASKCCSQLSVHWLEHWRYEYGTHGIAVAYTLCHSDDVWRKRGVAICQPLMSEEPATSSIAALYLVADKHGAAGGTQLAQALVELW